ncbi:MAG: 30S ribosomal protein S1 [Ardenticatenia bacterium]|jgi:small subunit ribosomal protein S1|nr:MAG: 30S ribosomal protein S1 [Ardenticatenia bacterium]
MEQEHLSGSKDAMRDEAMITMADLFDHSAELKDVKYGDILTGTVVRISPTEILIDIGCKCEGVVSGRELERLSPEDRAALKVGDKVSAYVLRPEIEDEGHVALSLMRAWVEEDWAKARRMFESGELYEGIVSGYNKGGLIVNFGHVRGFVPISQLESGRDAAKTGDESAWRQLIGQKLRLKIIEIDRQRNRLIMSERAAMQEWRKGQREQLMNSLKEGDVLTGRVSSLVDFGAFVDLGGADGLIHLSELSWMPVSHPREVVNVGDTVQVYVLHVDHARQRISLSLKRLQQEPWTQVLGQYEIGQIVPATITRLASFGAFARVGEVEGLIHISELTDENIAHPREVVQEGDAVQVKIIQIEPERRRMGLSLKQARGVADWEEYRSAQHAMPASSESAYDMPSAAMNADANDAAPSPIQG